MSTDAAKRRMLGLPADAPERGDIAAAKRRLLDATTALDPLTVVRGHPLTALGAACAAGLLASRSRSVRGTIIDVIRRVATESIDRR